MSDDVINQLKAVDPGVARAYKQALGSKPDDPIDIPGATLIYNAVFDGLTPKGKAAVTTTEAEALLMVLSLANLTQAAVDFIAQSMVAQTASKDMVLYEALFEGGAAELMTGDQLKNLTDLLSSALIDQLTFQSPGTKIPYFPHHYHAIKALILEGKIEM